jgi:hypothetical protein
MPVLTQKLGPWIKSTEISYYKKLSKHKEYMSKLIQMLPSYDYFTQNWDYSYTNYLPFFWKGFESSVRYTYIIEDLTDLDRIWKNFKGNIKRNIRKVKEKFNIEIKDDEPLSSFIELNNKTFLRQGLSPPYSVKVLNKLLHNFKKRKQCKWFIAQDNYKINHAGVLIVWDQESAYPSIPILYGSPGIVKNNNHLHLNLDIFGSAFFMLTRYEELVIKDRDQHDRFLHFLLMHIKMVI